ncbi:MAG: hypothetical protein M3430_15310 [Acidobacteriota bacterium]|nr:hypothetical protein [Acidobacteriota bacterium]
MTKKCLSLAMSVALLHALAHASFASETPGERSKKALLASQVKAGIAHLGTGESSRVRVLLNDKTKYHGHVTEIGEDYFVVADAKTGATAPIDYSEVKGVKGNNFSTGAKIGIGVAIAAAIAIAVVVAGIKDDEREESPCTLSAEFRGPCPPGCLCVQQ